MAEQRLTQNAKQTDDAARLQRAETQPEQEEQLVQTEAARLQRVMANPAGADPDDITGLQQTAGNRAVSQLLTSVTGPAEEPVIQAKLLVGAPGDRYEQEADRMADKVMATVVPAANQPDEPEVMTVRQEVAAQRTIQRNETEEERRRKQQLRTKVGNDYSRQNLERWKRRQQQQKQQPVTSQPKTETKQTQPVTKPVTGNLAQAQPETEEQKRQKQQTRWTKGNEYSRRNLERWKRRQQQKQQQPLNSQPKTEINQPVVAQQQQQTEQQPQQQQQTEQQKQPPLRRIPRFRVAELKAKHLRYQQKQMALALTGSNITKEMINKATHLIREGEETEEKKLLKQNLRKVIGQQFSDDNKQPQQQEQQQQPQQQDVKQEEPEDEAEFAAMATVALEKAEEAEKEAEDEAEETEEETEAAEEETEAEEAEEEEAAEEEEVEEEAEETEAEEEELGVTDWPLSVLLAKPEEEVVQRDVSPELKSSITAFSQPDTYRYDAETTKKRAASTRIAREEPGIPGLKGVSEDIWLKPLAGLMRQPAQTNDETETAPANNDGSFEVEDAVEQRLRQQKGKGQPLPTNVRSDMEARFGADFEQVRIHTGSEAAQLSETLHAQAFTHGNDIFFNAGKSNFDTTEDKRLLAHELTHVIQQMGYGKKDDPGNG